MTTVNEQQLSDLAFQRHILVQGLILIDFLLSLTEKAKKKWADVEKTNPKSANKGLLYAFTLSENNVCASNASDLERVLTHGRRNGLFQHAPRLLVTCRKDPRANSIIAWLTLCFRATRIG